MIAAGVGIVLLSMFIVMCSGAFERRNQNWTTVALVAIGMPLFFMIMSGVIGIFVG